MKLYEEISRIKSILYEDNHSMKKRKKYLHHEMDEIERASQDLSRDEGIDISVEDLLDAFEIADEVKIPTEVWENLENTESNQIEKGEMDKVVELAKKYNKSNPEKLGQALMSGDYNRPLIVKFGDRYHLVAGNTRLCTAAALGIKPQVIIAEI